MRKQPPGQEAAGPGSASAPAPHARGPGKGARGRTAADGSPTAPPSVKGCDIPRRQTCDTDLQSPEAAAAVRARGPWTLAGPPGRCVRLRARLSGGPWRFRTEAPAGRAPEPRAGAELQGNYADPHSHQVRTPGEEGLDLETRPLGQAAVLLSAAASAVLAADPRGARRCC